MDIFPSSCRQCIQASFRKRLFVNLGKRFFCCLFKPDRAGACLPPPGCETAGNCRIPPVTIACLSGRICPDSLMAIVCHGKQNDQIRDLRQQFSKWQRPPSQAAFSHCTGAEISRARARPATAA
ncbi:hypothetical protein Pden_0885 [Paracoccus denitrificans PD1222]|uniref:Uncharacterized protein n=1 Tax=Paracoccus denitrificans (strain Pd 1222) TaxID=318586 RepID=A1B0F2_PARDP|nr:hypothetical protein Pden_0885 [Paracoccus denitrificans PD1222]